jgi:hypothetical protein
VLTISRRERPSQQFSTKPACDKGFGNPGQLKKRHPWNAKRLPVFQVEHSTHECSRVRAVNDYEPADEGRIAVRENPTQRAAPVMRHEHRFVQLERFHQRLDVVG